MLMELATALALARSCAPDVAPETLLSVVHAESRLNPYAIGVNDGPRLARQPESRDEAVAEATRLIVVEGRNVDLGLGQINSRNLDWLGLSIADAFDPCRNLAGAGRVLKEGYLTSRDELGEGPAALGAALSRYNTGKPDKGFANGYVGRVKASALVVVPAITAEGGVSAPAEPARPAPRDFDVFEGETPGFDVFASDRESAQARQRAVVQPAGER